MNIANKNIFLFFISIYLLLLPLQLVQAESLFSPAKNMTQDEANQQQLELSRGQIRSRVKHRFINYVLGRTVDQYLDFGVDDEVAQKSSKQFKLRLNEHRLLLVYQSRFY